MATSQISQINYRGWIIEKETDLWPLKYGMNYKFHQGDEHVYHAETIEDAKIEIFDRTSEEPSDEHFVILNHRPYPFKDIEKAKEFALFWDAEALIPSTKI